MGGFIHFQTGSRLDMWIGCVGGLDSDWGCVLEKVITTSGSIHFQTRSRLNVWVDWIPRGGFLLHALLTGVVFRKRLSLLV